MSRYELKLKDEYRARTAADACIADVTLSSPAFANTFIGCRILSAFNKKY